MSIERKCRDIINYLYSTGEKITLVAAVKDRKSEDVLRAVRSGVKIIGENRVQEAEARLKEIGNELKKNDVKIHFIGKLQKNKINRALKIFDFIQSFHSLKIIEDVNKRAREPVMGLIEVNIGREKSKIGFLPEDVKDIVFQMERFENIRIYGLMTVEPYSNIPEQTRHYFKRMRMLFESLKRIKLPKNVKMRILSMGMSNSYKIAIEEGSNMIRIGTAIFGSKRR